MPSGASAWPSSTATASAARHVRAVGGEARNSLAVVETRLEDCQSVIYRNGAADFALTREDVERIDFARFGALVVTGTVLAVEPSRSAAFRAFALARAAGLRDRSSTSTTAPTPGLGGGGGRSVCGRAAAMSDIVIGNDVEFGVHGGRAGRGA